MLDFVALGDGVELLTRLRLEGKSTKADVVLGLDLNLASEAAKTGLFAPAGVDLSAKVPEPPLTAEIDPARIRSVVGNLLSNALRHTHSGGSIRVEVMPSNDQAVVTVTDDGEGIPPDLLPHVFERFVKGAESNGSGLGLAIAHDIAEAHGGTLEVESETGSGTRLKLSLPLENE